MSSESAPTQEADATCPICGDEYDHKREELKRTVGKEAELRGDATACKTSELGGKRTVYIHR